MESTVLSKKVSQVHGLAKLLVLERHAEDAKVTYGQIPRGRARRAYTANDPYVVDRVTELEASRAEVESDYSGVFIPWGPLWFAPQVIGLLDYKDKAQYFSRLDRAHTHIVVMGIDHIFNGKSSWCSLCKDGLQSQSGVSGDLNWLQENPGRQLLTGSFHPVTDDQWTDDAYGLGLSVPGQVVNPTAPLVQFQPGNAEPRVKKVKAKAKVDLTSIDLRGQAEHPFSQSSLSSVLSTAIATQTETSQQILHVDIPQPGYEPEKVYTTADILQFVYHADTLSLSKIPNFVDSRVNEFQEYRNPLIVAVLLGNLAVIRFLLRQNVNVNVQSPVLRLSPLHLACYICNGLVVNLLLGAGARVDLTDMRGWTPVEYAAYFGNEEILRQVGCKTVLTNSTLLHLAVKGNRLSAVNYLINSQHMSTTARDSEMLTPLDLAVSYGYHAVASVLIHENPGLELPSPFPKQVPIRKPLPPTYPRPHALAWNDDPEVNKLQRNELTQLNQKKETPLHLAALGGAFDSVRNILSRGVGGVNAHSGVGSTPLDYAYFTLFSVLSSMDLPHPDLVSSTLLCINTLQGRGGKMGSFGLFSPTIDDRSFHLLLVPELPVVRQTITLPQRRYEGGDIGRLSQPDPDHYLSASKVNAQFGPQPGFSAAASTNFGPQPGHAGGWEEPFFAQPPPPLALLDFEQHPAPAPVSLSSFPAPHSPELPTYKNPPSLDLYVGQTPPPAAKRSSIKPPPQPGQLTIDSPTPSQRSEPVALPPVEARAAPELYYNRLPLVQTYSVGIASEHVDPIITDLQDDVLSAQPVSTAWSALPQMLLLISSLHRASRLTRSERDVLKDMIFSENISLRSAFEVFQIEEDIDDFVETARLIVEARTAI